MASRILFRISKGGGGNFYRPILVRQQEPLHCISHGSLTEPTTSALWVPCQLKFHRSFFGKTALQWSGFSSSAPPHPADTTQPSNEQETAAQVDDSHKTSSHDTDTDKGKMNADTNNRSFNASDETEEADEEFDLSIDDLIKLVDEKEELLKLKHKEIEKMQDKVLRSYAEMENVLDRTKREAENSKKFAIQNFAKSLLDVADNLGRASSVVKESFSKIDESKDSVGAVPLLKVLLEGVEMTDKQLAEVFRKYGVEKFDPTDEHFDPHRHHAVFQIPNASKPPGIVAALLKPGYMLYDRVIRPAEVGVTEALNDESSDK